MSWRVLSPYISKSPNPDFYPARHTPLQKERKVMKTPATITESEKGMAEILHSLDQECNPCSPVSPLECITNCNVSKLRNALRLLCETMQNPNYTKDHLNVLKNNTRIAILQTIVNGRYSVDRLQQKLKKAGYLHSQDTIVEEYLRPLLNVGLAAESHDQFYATAFGGRLNNLIENIPTFTNELPSHSECHEETILKALLDGPKTFEEVKLCVPPKIVSRTLKRLKTAQLIQTPHERDYIFFFKSKRDQTKEVLSTTESKVYNNIDLEGISAKKLQVPARLKRQKTGLHTQNPQNLRFNRERRTPRLAHQRTQQDS
jgi:hypothetical protein